MAIAIDTSPALVSGATSTQTTATFSPGADRLLVACIAFQNTSSSFGSGTPATITVSNTVSALTWTLRVRRDWQDSSGENGIVAVYTAATTGTGSITNTTVSAVSGQASDRGALKVYVVSGANTSSPIGAVGEGSSTSKNITPNAYVSTINNSRGFGIAEDWGADGAPTSSDTGTSFHIASQISGIAVNKTADTATSGSTVTMNFNGATGTSDWQWNWVAVEVKPSLLQTVTASSIASSEAWGTAQLNLRLTLAGIASAGAFGTTKVNLFVSPSSIASQEAFGTAFVGTIVLPSSIASSEAWGSTTIHTFNRASPVGILTGERWGSASVILGYPQTVTLDGIGSGELWGETVVSLRSRYIFVTPSIEETPVALDRLNARFRLSRGITVLKLSGGSYIQVRYPAQTELEDEDIMAVYMGGHRHAVSAAEAAALTLAGYGPNITTEIIP